LTIAFKIGEDWGWGFSSVVERLPRKRKALGSVPSSEKKKKENQKAALEVSASWRLKGQETLSLRVIRKCNFLFIIVSFQ